MPGAQSCSRLADGGGSSCRAHSPPQQALTSFYLLSGHSHCLPRQPDEEATPSSQPSATHQQPLRMQERRSDVMQAAACPPCPPQFLLYAHSNHVAACAARDMRPEAAVRAGLPLQRVCAAGERAAELQECCAVISSCRQARQGEGEVRKQGGQPPVPPAATSHAGTHGALSGLDNCLPDSANGRGRPAGLRESDTSIRMGGCSACPDC